MQISLPPQGGFGVLGATAVSTDTFQPHGQRRAELLDDLVASSWIAKDHVLPSGATSPYFVVPELFVTKVTIVRRLASMLADIIPAGVDRVVACLPGPDLVLSTAIALDTGLPLVIASGQASDPSWLGELHPEENVVVIECVVSSGITAQHVVRQLVSERVTVAGVVAAVDRGEGAEAMLREVGSQMLALFEAPELLEAARQHAVREA